MAKAAAAAPFQSLAQELPYAAVRKKKKTNQKFEGAGPDVFTRINWAFYSLPTNRKKMSTPFVCSLMPIILLSYFFY